MLSAPDNVAPSAAPSCVRLICLSGLQVTPCLLYPPCDLGISGAHVTVRRHHHNTTIDRDRCPRFTLQSSATCPDCVRIALRLHFPADDFSRQALPLWILLTTGQELAFKPCSTIIPSPRTLYPNGWNQ